MCICVCMLYEVQVIFIRAENRMVEKNLNSKLFKIEKTKISNLINNPSLKIAAKRSYLVISDL